MEDNKFDADQFKLLRLNMRNWNTEFKEAFKEFSLKKGEPGEEINTGKAVKIRMADDFDELDDDGERMYADNDRGYKRWERDNKRYREYI
jgi:hypothetical protein